MSYHNRITTLVESLKLLNSRIEQISDDAQIKEAIQQKTVLEREISRLHRLEFEESYERLNLDDDR
jgi:hypothetical protein